MSLSVVYTRKILAQSTLFTATSGMGQFWPETVFLSKNQHPVLTSNEQTAHYLCPGVLISYLTTITKLFKHA
jgi:hypothetical protein